VRIGMMVDMYKPHVSGITTYVAQNKQILEQQGHKVYVFTFGDPAYEDDELYVIRSPGLPVNVQDTGFHLSFRYSQTAQIKLRAMDVVHVHHPFLSGPLALRYCRPLGIPVIFTNHTRYDLYSQYYLPGPLRDVVGTAFLQAYLPDFCRHCQLVIAPSQGIVKILRDTIGVTAPITVIPNGIDLSPFEDPPLRIKRAAVGLPEDAVVLMYVGRLNPEKNLPFLLRAFFGVAAAVPRPVLALVGDGSETDNLRDQAERSGFGDRVKFLGQVAYADVPNYLALADIFVSASDTEVHPLSLIEALAAGLPALGIDSPGVADTISDNENGFLSSCDMAEFTAKLMRLVTEPNTRRRFAARSRQLARQYDIHRTSQAVLTQYERLAAERGERERGLSGLRQRIGRFFRGQNTR
jgi:1,2-diacylglycerol 3-alpha-glucosyltransferase